jgi:hypothetical protein
MAKEHFVQNFRGISGHSHRFDVYTADSFFADISAVYVFAKRVTDITPLYIGESGELGTRMKSHEKWPCVKQHGCTHICVLEIEGEEQRKAIETDIRLNYRR